MEPARSDAAFAPGGAHEPGPAPAAEAPPRWVVAVPLPVLTAGMAALWLWAPERVFSAPGLVLALNFVFATLVAMSVVYLAMRGFLLRGEPGLLLLACGAEIWGIGGLLSSAAGWEDPNVSVTVHNTCALLSGVCHLAGVAAARVPGRRIRARDLAALLGLGGGLLLVALVTGLAQGGAFPTFFVQGRGGTPVRQVVAVAAVASFALAGLLLAAHRVATPFARLYAQALGLVAAGILGVILQASFGSLLGWTARLTQFVGGVYMLAAAVATLRQQRGWEMSLEAGLADAESRLRQREVRYRTFFENLREAVAVYEGVPGADGAPAEWFVREANDLFARAVGLPRSRVMDRPVTEVFGAEDAARFSADWEAVLRTGEPRTYERHGADGRTIAVQAFRLDARHVAVAGLDMTERLAAERRLRDSERLYRAIGESIDYGVWVCDPSGRNLYASDSFLRLVGLTQQQCSDFGWGDVLHPDDAERTLAAWKACVRAGGTWDIEHRFRGADGRWHPILARGVPVRNEQGEIVCWAGINLDIARLKEAEERLRESDQRKSEFLAVLSHELRNPLAPIRNGVRLLGLTPAGSPQAVRALAMIERQAEHLTRLVDDLLDATRIARGKVELARERLDLREIVIRTCDDHRPIFAQRGVALQVSVGAPAFADVDGTRVSQVLGNLLQNGLKFTPEGGHVTVALSAREAAAELRVEDDGAGIDPAFLPKLFEPFAQADRGLARTHGGLGLGLSVVKGLVDLHGGTVSARSAGEGRGSTFLVTLPLAPDAPASTAAAPEPPRAGAGLDILLVEDGEDAAQSLADLLELAGHRVRVARDGRSGIALARLSPPQVILCDIGLPDVDGYGVARTLRADPALAGTRLVALSGYALPEDRERARAAGFERHLAKPPRFEELEALLAEVAPRR